MSAMVIIPIVIPTIAPLAWPLFAAAAGAAASSLGFAGVSAGVEAAEMEAANEVVLDGLSCTEVASTLLEGDTAVFTRGDVALIVARDAAGKVTVRVTSETRSKSELEAIGREMVGRVVQQYAYHRIVTEMKSRNFNVVDETVEEDGTVRLKVRVYQDR